jgi:hypothetical protein
MLWVNRIVVVFNLFELQCIERHLPGPALLGRLIRVSNCKMSPEQVHFTSMLKSDLRRWCSQPPLVEHAGGRGAKVMNSIIERATANCVYGAVAPRSIVL